MSASIQQVKAAIDAAAKGTGFSCKTVSWEDAQRGHTFGGGLSCAGPNISDVRLYEKTGKLLYTVRSDNWNERLGYVAARDVAMVTGNEKSTASTLEPTTLQDFLQSIGQRAGYVGCTTPSLFEPTLDGIFGIRFQTVFLPVENASFGSATPPKTEFCTEVFNYQTRSDDDPRNMLLLATPQGTSVQQDGAGNARQYFHSVDSNGTVHRYWLEAEKSEKAVGGAQSETVAEQQAAAARGKAVAVRLGPSSMGTRFNVQMLIQIPLKQKPRPAPRHFTGTAWGANGDIFSSLVATPSMPPSANACFMPQCAPASTATRPACSKRCSESFTFSVSQLRRDDRRGDRDDRRSSRAGASNAARVSRGTEQDVYSGVANKTPERDPSQHGTITVTTYYTVVGGVPSVADVKAAIQDLDGLFKQCPSDKKLVHCHEVTSHAGTGLFQPPPPPPPAPTFPSPFEQPKTLPTPVVPEMVCTMGHGMTPSTQTTAPPRWICDGCGCFVEPPKINGALVQGFACRACDFDVCMRCAKLPKCPTGRPLTTLPKTAVPMTLEQQVFTRCNLCMKQFARDVASMRGCQSPACNHPPFSACEPCLAASATP